MMLNFLFLYKFFIHLTISCNGGLGIEIFLPVFFQLISERGAADAELAGGIGNIAAALLDGGEHDLLVPFIEVEIGFEQVLDIGFVAAAGRGAGQGACLGGNGQEGGRGGEAGKQGFGLDGAVVVGENHAALDHVFQLADVARPRVVEQQLAAVVADAGDVFLIKRGVFFQKILNQQRNILAALAQGRDKHGKGVEAVIQVGTKAPLLHGFEQVFIGGRHHAHVDFAGLAAAHALELALLQHAQKRGLCAW